MDSNDKDVSKNSNLISSAPPSSTDSPFIHKREIDLQTEKKAEHTDETASENAKVEASKNSIEDKPDDFDYLDEIEKSSDENSVNNEALEEKPVSKAKVLPPVSSIASSVSPQTNKAQEKDEEDDDDDENESQNEKIESDEAFDDERIVRACDPDEAQSDNKNANSEDTVNEEAAVTGPKNSKKKFYPHVTRPRKWFMFVGAGVICVLVLLLINTVANSFHRQSVAESENGEKKVESMASAQDAKTTNEAAASKLANAKAETVTKTQNKTAAAPVSSLGKGMPISSVTSVNAEDAQEAQQAKEAQARAMAAPLNSNMLKATDVTMQAGPTGTSGTALANPGLAASSVALGNEANLQAEKKAFLQVNSQPNSDDYLHASVQSPLSQFEVQAGTVIPGVLLTGIDSDLPGQITGQVTENVYDSVSGNALLIPQGAKLIGLYDSNVAYGQSRVLVAWKRIIFPNGQCMDLQGMPGADLSGYAGFHDVVDNHYFRIFGSAVLMSLISAGAQLSQPQQSNTVYGNNAPSVSQTVAASLGSQLSQTGLQITQKNLNIQPTLEIRPGYQFNIQVTKDMVFPGPYGG